MCKITRPVANQRHAWPSEVGRDELTLLVWSDWLQCVRIDDFEHELRLDQVHPGVKHILVSARTGEGIEAWRDWLGAVAHRQRVPA